MLIFVFSIFLVRTSGVQPFLICFNTFSGDSYPKHYITNLLTTQPSRLPATGYQATEESCAHRRYSDP
jgi:hypothetical protein